MPDNRNRKRPIQVKFFVDERELSLIKARMAQLGIENMSAYLRKMGIAGKLAKAAQHWCEANGLASLTVTCAPCDAGMYQALGFDARLGQTFAYLR